MARGDDFEDVFLRHEPEPAELVIVFGHFEPLVAGWRARHAADLYHRGLAPTLLLSGGCLATAESEAQLMATTCLDLGVPRDRLLLEGGSRTTFENAARALELLTRDALLDSIRTILLVSCPWHMRRVYLTARQAFPAGIRFRCCPHDEGCTEANWRESAECRTRVAAERELLRHFTEAGLLRKDSDGASGSRSPGR
jgi:vancomycin permeability regulator SanA